MRTMATKFTKKKQSNRKSEEEDMRESKNQAIATIA